MATSPKPQIEPPQRLLLIRRSSIGDIVNTMPTLVALRRGFPDAHISWLVDHRFQEILQGHDCLDDVIPVRRHSAREIIPLIGELLRARRLLRSRQFDMAIDPQGLLKSALISYLSGAPRRLGFDDERELSTRLVNEIVPGDHNLHAVDRFLLMAEYLGCPTQPVEFRLPISPAGRQWAADFLSGNPASADGRLIGLNVGAFKPHRCWPTAHFAKLAELLLQHWDVPIVLIGGPGDRQRAESIKQQTTVPLIDAVGHTTLSQLPALIDRCAVLVSADTGATHIAVALDTPVVALFGPSFPHLTGPHGDNNIVLWSQPECACWNKPTCRDYPCMRAISPESVFQAIQELLARNR